jgi:DNA-binding NarL/FixJ family response regulator
MGVQAILSAEPDIELLAQSETGPDAVALFRQHRPDVALVDLRLPERRRRHHSDARRVRRRVGRGADRGRGQRGRRSFKRSGLPMSSG